MFLPVLRIHDILVWIWIRIRIRGSMTLTNGSGSGSCCFRHWPLRCQQKVLKKCVCLILFEGTFRSFFKDTNSRRSHETVGIKGLTIFAWWKKDPDPDPYLWLIDLDPDQGGPKTYGSDRFLLTNWNWRSNKLFCPLSSLISACFHWVRGSVHSLSARAEALKVFKSEWVTGYQLKSPRSRDEDKLKRNKFTFRTLLFKKPICQLKP